MKDLDLRVRRKQAFMAFEQGDFRNALVIGTELLRRNAQDTTLREVVGVAAAKVGRVGQAERELRKALKLQPRKSILLHALAEAYQQQGKLDEAIAQYDRALAVAPDDRIALGGKAMILQRRGRLDEARALIQPLIDAGREDATIAAVYATIEQSAGRYRETIEPVMRHLSSPAIDFAARKTLCALAAKAYERVGDYDKAFEAFTLSNRLIERPFDAEVFVAAIDELIATFSRQNLAMLARAREESTLPVFVASLPRSGSTLVEQIIHAHPRAQGAGEITDLHAMVLDLPARLGSIQEYPACLGDFTPSHADTLAAWYIEQLRAYNERADRVVNKHLENWRHIGMIALLLPVAKIIHCRRNPMDNCFSIYMAAMNPEAYPWASDLAAIGLVHHQYERLMAHWRDVLDLEILEIEYETLVADAEPWIRRIIDFCGLPWDDRCLRFHEADRDVMTLSYDQVRRPIYTSAVRRHEKYAAHLGPLRDVLRS